MTQITAHHKGHFEFYACAITAGQSPTQACFRANPLEFVEDLLYGSPKDVNYPYRAYIAPPAISSPMNNMFSYRMKLPGNIVCDLVLIQWWYLTGNTCDYAGYEQYTWPANWGNMDSPISKCIAPAYSSAEQFWNCAEVKIVDIGQPTTTPAPTPPTATVVPTVAKTPAPTVKLTPAPVLATGQPTPTQAPMPPSTTAAPTATLTPAPTVKVTAAPVPTPAPQISSTSFPVVTPIVKVGNFCGTSWANAGLKCSISCNDGNSTVCNAGEYCYAGVSCPVATTAPTKAPAVVVVGTCGSGVRGNGICPDAALCCSAWGYCGTGSPWCDTTAPVPAPSSVGTCGGGQRGNGICPQTGLCCSAWGYCGTGAQYCTRRNLHGHEEQE